MGVIHHCRKCLETGLKHDGQLTLPRMGPSHCSTTDVTVVLSPNVDKDCVVLSAASQLRGAEVVRYAARSAQLVSTPETSAHLVRGLHLRLRTVEDGHSRRRVAVSARTRTGTPSWHITAS